MENMNKDPEFGAQQTEPTMDDINALLVKAGLSPIGEDGAELAGPEKTKHFSLPQQESAQPASERTRVMPAATKVVAQPLQPVEQPVEQPAPDAQDKPSSAKKNDSQILLDGFDDSETPRHVDEAEEEERLKFRRKNLVENFRVLSQDEDDQTLLEKETEGDGAKSVFDALEVKQGEPLFDAVDQAQQTKPAPKRIYFDRSKLTQRLTPQEEQQETVDLKTRREYLAKFMKKAKVTLIAQAALFGLALLLMVSASFYLPGGALEFLFGRGARPFSFFNLLLILVAAAFSADVIARAVADIKARRVTSSVCVSALAALSVLHALWMLIGSMDESTGYISFAVCGIFALFVQTAARFISARTEDNDLTVLQNSETLQQLQSAENVDDAMALGRGISSKKTPNILYASPLTGSEHRMPVPKASLHEKTYLYGMLIAAGLSFVFALVRAIGEKSAAVFINALVSTAFLCVPLLRLLLTAVLKTKNDAGLSTSGVVVGSLEAAGALADADAVVADAGDLFDAKVSNFRSVPGGRMSKQDAAIYAASALQNSGSLMADSFSNLAQELDRRIPLAEDLQYEEKLGYGCWVAGRRVLVGTRDMLVQHSVPAPSEEEEKSYAGKRMVLYVAVEGLVAATFTVSYRVRGEAKRAARVFDKTGLLLMLSCGDPGLTEEFVARKLSLDVAAIKLMSSKNAQLVAELRQSGAQGAPSGLVCSGKHRHLLLLVSAAHRLFEADKIGGIVQAAGQGFCFLLLLLCVIFKISSFFMPLTVIFLQLLWSFAAYYVGTTRMK